MGVAKRLIYIFSSRYYVQLPTLEAHEYHTPEKEGESILKKDRLHPSVREKIREFVCGGITDLYTIRKQLR